MSSLTRTQRASRLRDEIKGLVETSSWRQASEATGVSVGSLQNFVLGRKRPGSEERDPPGVPNNANMRKLEKWAREAGVLHEETNPDRPIWLSNQAIGEIVEDIRTRCAMTQTRFAKEVGASGQEQVSRWENGHERPPYETMAAIADLDGKTVKIFQEPPRATATDVNPMFQDGVRGSQSLAQLDVQVMRERSAAGDEYVARVRYGVDWPGEPDDLVDDLERILTTWVPRDMRTAVRQGSDRQLVRAIRLSFQNNSKVPERDRDVIIGAIDRILNATPPKR